MLCIWFLISILKFSLPTFKTIFETLSVLGGKQEPHDFRKFAMISQRNFHICSWDLFLSTILSLFYCRHQSLIIRTLFNLQFLAFCCISWTSHLSTYLQPKTDFLTKNSLNVQSFTQIKTFFHNIELWANNQYNANSNFVKYTALVLAVPFSVLRKTWNLVSG